MCTVLEQYPGCLMCTVLEQVSRMFDVYSVRTKIKGKLI